MQRKIIFSKHSFFRSTKNFQSKKTKKCKHYLKVLKYKSISKNPFQALNKPEDYFMTKCQNKQIKQVIYRIFRIDRSSMIQNVRMYVCPYVCPEPYNLPNRNRYEKSVRKKLRIDKIRCNEKLFFQNTLFFGLRKIISRKKHVFFQIKIVKDMKYLFKKQKVSS